MPGSELRAEFPVFIGQKRRSTTVKNLRRRFDRFIYNNGNKGIPNLMLFICAATLISYFIMLADSSNMFYNFICFNRYQILHGQVWRLITYIIVPENQGLWLFLLLFAYYGIGRMVENTWGTLKFNLFYLVGVIIMDIAALLLGTTARTSFLNLSLFLALATLYPESKVMLMYIIPLKMKYLAWAYLLLLLVEVVQMNFFPIFALLNYFLFFGMEWINVLPEFMQRWFRRSGRKNTGNSGYQSTRPNRNWAKSYRNTDQNSARKSTQKSAPKSARTAKTGTSRSSSSQSSRIVDAPAYRHKCTICGRTDVSNPELEFRYCSKCKGYYCYCEDHINNHVHIQ